MVSTFLVGYTMYLLPEKFCNIILNYVLRIGYTPRARLLSDLATDAKSLSNQARGVQPACTMTIQNSKKNQVDK